MRLYDLTDTYVSILARLEDAETDTERDQLLTDLVNVEGDISDKAESYAKMMRNAQAEATGYDAEIKRLQAKKRATDNLVSRLKDYLLYSMEVAGAKEIRTSIGKWYTQKNPMSVTVLDPALVPERFLIPQAPAVDKQEIIREFKQTGELFDGLEITQTTGIRFR